MILINEGKWGVIGMQTLNYLCRHFYTREQLRSRCALPSGGLARLQACEVMPVCAYELELKYSGLSFMGEFQAHERVEFYPKGLVDWCAEVQDLQHADLANAVFNKRYRARLNSLRLQGHSSEDSRFNHGLPEHLQSEWSDFIDGAYGMSTRSGLPEDIAAMELALSIIKPLMSADRLNQTQRQRLESSVNLLDQVCAPFAPHEQANSVRGLWVDRVRRAHNLPTPGQGASTVSREQVQLQ